MIKQAIEKQDPTIDELANIIADVIIKDYGGHNYTRFMSVISSRVCVGEDKESNLPWFEDILKEVYTDGFSDTRFDFVIDNYR